MRKRQAWEETWDLQRREDAGEKVGPIPVPPKYTTADFRKQSWWQHRGKLDVPKERFILYPDAGRATDPTMLLGWAGWDHAQQALALILIIGERESEGCADESTLVPLVGGAGRAAAVGAAVARHDRPDDGGEPRRVRRRAATGPHDPARCDDGGPRRVAPAGVPPRPTKEGMTAR